MLHSLYARLATALVILLLAVGTLYTLVTLFTTQHHLQQLTQQFNRDLARRIVEDRELVASGELDQEALKATFSAYMQINPSIEIYLLDLKGKILSFSADPGKVKRNQVSLRPIQAFLNGEGFPLLGDDPRSHDRMKAFSVTTVPSMAKPEGYLYVVLQGEEYESATLAVEESYVLRLSVWVLAGSLGFGLLAGLILFFLLTRRLRRLSTDMQRFHASDFRLQPAPSDSHRKAGDEIADLDHAFRLMAERISQQLTLLRGQDQTRRELVAQISHDLRTPLTSLHGYLETLQKRQPAGDGGELQEYLQIAIRQSQRLKQMVEELFELANLEAQDSHLTLESCSLAELVQDVVQKFTPLAEARGIVLRFSPPEESTLAEIDIALIERVMDNLINNALDHSTTGGRVELSLTHQAERLTLEVRDTGPGIASADLPHLFDSFFRAPGRRSELGHAGLGLAIARRVIDLHQGEIVADNHPEGGARIRFSLPVSRPL